MSFLRERMPSCILDLDKELFRIFGGEIIYLETASGTASLFEVSQQKFPPRGCSCVYVRTHVTVQAVIFPLPLLLDKCSCEEPKPIYREKIRETLKFWGCAIMPSFTSLFPASPTLLSNLQDHVCGSASHSLFSSFLYSFARPHLK